MTRTQELISISSSPLCQASERLPDLLGKYDLGWDVFRLLSQKNGFYAFESALHVFPIGCSPQSEFDLEFWNSQTLWRYEYHDLADRLLFFAEDLFQDQFCLSERGVLRFKAETAETVLVGSSLEEWADRILSDHRTETAWPIARQWQSEHGPLPPGKRLMPKKPFFLGGEYALSNLWLGDAAEGMRFKGNLAFQTKSLPEGSRVRLRLSKDSES